MEGNQPGDSDHCNKEIFHARETGRVRHPLFFGAAISHFDLFSKLNSQIAGGPLLVLS